MFVDKLNNLLFEKREFSNEGKAGDMCLETLLEIENQIFSHARRTKKMNMSQDDVIRKQKHVTFVKKNSMKMKKRSGITVITLQNFLGN